ncbi:MAG TPA: carbon monoxide dehydrogenase subunit G [Candidatus Binatia bacterium]
MKIAGRYSFPGATKKVWDLLTDPKALQHCTPGCKQLEEVGTDEYAATMQIGVGPITGTYNGKIRISDKEEPNRYKLHVEGSGAAGFVRGEGLLTLEPEEADKTAVIVSGDAQVGGLVAGVGQRLMEGVAKQFMGQFFKCMAGQLADRK